MEFIPKPEPVQQTEEAAGGIPRAEAPLPIRPSTKSSAWSWIQGVAAAAADVASQWVAGSAAVPEAAAAGDVEAPLCPICFAEPPTFSPPCGHALCTSCAVAYLRGALGDAQTQIHPQGVRCPMHASGCEDFITSTDARRLLSNRDARCQPSPTRPRAAEQALPGNLHTAEHVFRGR